jgi:hypothetical protein
MIRPESSLEIYQFPCLSDNYGFLIRDNKNDLYLKAHLVKCGILFKKYCNGRVRLKSIVRMNIHKPIVVYHDY